MNAGQEQNIVEPEKTEFIVVIDPQKRLCLDCPTGKTDLFAQPVADDNEDTQKNQGAPKSDRSSDSCQNSDDWVNLDPIVAEYKNADLNRRLQIYLQFPLLKSEFDSINRNDRHLISSADFELRVQSFATQMGMALGSAMAGSVPVP